MTHSRTWVPVLIVCLLFVSFSAVCLAQDEGAEAQPAEAAGGAAEEGAMEGTEEAAIDSSLANLLASVETPVEEAEASGGGVMTRFKESGLVTLFFRGGKFMYALLLTSIIGVAFIIERLITLTRARTDTRRLMKRVLDALHSKGVEAAAQECERTRGPIASILHAGLKRADMGSEAVERAIVAAGTVETSFLERGLIWLSTVATIAPLIGFLGTVSGMINAFNAIAEAEQVNAKLVASGISEALITTATGLIVAIPMQTFHNYFVSQIDRFIIEMEESSADLVDTLVVLGKMQPPKVGE
jgi:biopolymer transport protein ExbB